MPFPTYSSTVYLPPWKNLKDPMKGVKIFVNDSNVFLAFVQHIYYLFSYFCVLWPIFEHLFLYNMQDRTK